VGVGGRFTVPQKSFSLSLVPSTTINDITLFHRLY